MDGLGANVEQLGGFLHGEQVGRTVSVGGGWGGGALGGFVPDDGAHVLQQLRVRYRA